MSVSCDVVRFWIVSKVCRNTEGKWIRVEAEVVSDERLEAKVSMLDNNPELKSMYQATDDNTEVLYLTNATSTIYSFTEEPIVFKF